MGLELKAASFGEITLQVDMVGIGPDFEFTVAEDPFARFRPAGQARKEGKPKTVLLRQMLSGDASLRRDRSIEAEIELSFASSQFLSL